LRIPGETTYRVPSLDAPAAASAIDGETLLQYPAARLFVDRAAAVRQEFRLTAATAPAVASICRRLDGIPLAIELAATRLRSLSVDEIDRRLDQRFRMLTGGTRTALPRQQTLRALIDWSYDLLSATEKELFCRLAVFAGDWSLDAAEVVCEGGFVDRADVMDLVTSLVDKSLLTPEERHGLARYRLLETVREYAGERLREKGELDGWRARHLEHFVALVDEAEPHLQGADADAWLDRLDAEIDNIRSALAWAAATPAHVARGLDLAGAFSRFWYRRGLWAEGRAMLSDVLAKTASAAPNDSRARALSGAGVMAAQQGDYAAARPLYEEGLAIRRQLGDRLGVASSLGYLANLAAEQGDFPRAQALHEESLAIRRELGDRFGIALSLGNLGLAALEQGDYATARSRGEESLALRRELGDRWGVAIALSNLGCVALDMGDHAAARSLLEESLGIRRGLEDRFGIADSLCLLGSAACARGDWPAARAAADQSLAIFEQLDERSGIANALGVLGRVALATGEARTAHRHFARSLALSRDLGHQRSTAIALEDLAAVAVVLGDPAGALRVWTCAGRLRERIGSPRPPADQLRYDAQLAEVRAASDDVTFERVRDEGAALTIDEAVAYVLRLGPGECPGTPGASR
jgi:non-specific serine/threonine protein kinase